MHSFGDWSVGSSLKSYGCGADNILVASDSVHAFIVLVRTFPNAA